MDDQRMIPKQGRIGYSCKHAEGVNRGRDGRDSRLVEQTTSGSHRITIDAHFVSRFPLRCGLTPLPRHALRSQPSASSTRAPVPARRARKSTSVPHILSTALAPVRVREVRWSRRVGRCEYRALVFFLHILEVRHARP